MPPELTKCSPLSKSIFPDIPVLIFLFSSWSATRECQQNDCPQRSKSKTGDKTISFFQGRLHFAPALCLQHLAALPVVCQSILSLRLLEAGAGHSILCELPAVHRASYGACPLVGAVGCCSHRGNALRPSWTQIAFDCCTWHKRRRRKRQPSRRTWTSWGFKTLMIYSPILQDNQQRTFLIN